MSGRERRRGAGRGREGKIVIATAIPEEFEAISRAASCTRRSAPTAGSSSSGRMGNANVTVVLTGDGPARAAAALSTFEEIFLAPPAGDSPLITLIGAGVCGALTPGLSPGEILVSSGIVDESGDTPAPDSALVARAVALGAKSATLVTVARPLVSSNEKRDALERVGRGDSRGGGRRSGGASPAPVPAAVDMESAGWARAAASRGVPFVILRAVADTFEESLPSFLSDCLDASGSVDRARVARGAALRPWTLPRLLEMRARVRDASGRLAEFLARFLHGGLARG